MVGNRQSVAVLGAGSGGVCCALELAQRGHQVTLFDQDERPVRRASRVNEGKIHAGFLYANDSGARTAERMFVGALSFAEVLSRWLGRGRDHLHLSTPFVYGIHRDTMVAPETLKRHYAYCTDRVAALSQASGLTYLGLGEALRWRQRDAAGLEAILDPAQFVAAFDTNELAVDPRPVAEALAKAVDSNPSITFCGGARVTGVARRGDGRFAVAFDRDGPQTDSGFDQVVNALWEGRLTIDRQMGLPLPPSWSHRHKFGNRIAIPLAPGDLPSVTAALGPFGDIVNFGANGMFLSWYPAGMVDLSRAIEPGPGWDALSRQDRMQIFHRSLEEWHQLCPPLARLSLPDAAVDPVSGQIFAFGDTDIDDCASKLHGRFDVGVQSRDGYHSLNTGKYVLAPLLGLLTAARVDGNPACLPGLPALF